MLAFKERKRERKNYVGSDKPPSILNKEKSRFGTESGSCFPALALGKSQSIL
jgi:hypothetical protein